MNIYSWIILYDQRIEMVSLMEGKVLHKAKYKKYSSVTYLLLHTQLSFQETNCDITEEPDLHKVKGVFLQTESIAKIWISFIYCLTVKRACFLPWLGRTTVMWGATRSVLSGSK